VEIMSNKLSYKFAYRRKLPHIQPEGSTFFVTSRLAGSLPVAVVERLHRERDLVDAELTKIADSHERAEKAYQFSGSLFGKWDTALDTSNTDTKHLVNTKVAKMVVESLHFRDGKVYELLAYCIMPNHIHIVFTPLEESKDEYVSLSKIMHSLKLHTPHEANLILGRTGTFWQHENYDHFARDEKELERIIKYVLHNPVKANLAKEQTDWKWSYCKCNM
jgi:REP element-mobilizing transposase RayT